MRKKKTNIFVFIISLRWLFLAPILFYKKCVSPFLPHRCIYFPSCSNYMLDCIKRFGLLGVFLGLKRIVSCNPFAKGGFDPVPEKKRDYKALY